MKSGFLRTAELMLLKARTSTVNSPSLGGWKSRDMERSRLWYTGPHLLFINICDLWLFYLMAREPKEQGQKRPGS